jgi:hypothetical protein
MVDFEVIFTILIVRVRAEQIVISVLIKIRKMTTYSWSRAVGPGKCAVTDTKHNQWIVSKDDIRLPVGIDIGDRCASPTFVNEGQLARDEGVKLAGPIPDPGKECPGRSILKNDVQMTIAVDVCEGDKG